MTDNSDLTDDYWALRAALDYASECFESSPTSPDVAWRKEEDDMLNRAWEALDAIKSRLGL